MKKLLFYVLLLISINGFCQWNLTTNYPTSGTTMPFCFTVGGKAYLGCGYNSSFVATISNYEYNPTSNSWVIKATPPFTARMGAFSFSIGSYGYVGSGSPNGSNIVFNDFWRYDSSTDTWTAMAPFPGVGRIEAAAFTINGKGYVVSGIRSAGNPSDCWEYDPITNTWTAMANPPLGFTSGYVTGFSHGNYGYVGIGGINSVNNNDFWRFDPSSNTWTQLASLPAVPTTRTWTVSGIDLINGKGFVGLGSHSTLSLVDFWTYDFVTDSWQSTPSLYNFPYPLANGRTFSLNGEIYIGTGYKPTGAENNIYKFSCSNLPSNITNGLIAYYPFNNGTVNDFSGNTHHLTNVHGAQPASDRNGNLSCALEFDNLPNSNNQFLTTTSSSFLDGLTEYSVSCWYMAKDASRGITDYEVLVGRDTGSITCPDRVGQWSLGLYDCRHAVFGRDISVWEVPSSTCNETNVWHHLTATYNQMGQTISLYKDGVLQNTVVGVGNCGIGNTPTVQDIGDLFLGKGFTGVLDDVFIHNRALSLSEVTQLYGLGSSCCGTITCASLVTPTFNSIGPICIGDTSVSLPTTSVNGITGTWSPTFNNTATTTYTFTPNQGQCATAASLTIVVNQNNATVCLPAVKDTFLHEFLPDDNFGSNAALTASRWTYGISGGIGFYSTKVLNEFDLSNIPPSATITSAVMKLHVDVNYSGYNQHLDLGGGTGNGATITQVGGSWLENTVTWNTAPTLLSNSVTIPSLGNGSTNDVIVDVTGIVQNMISNGTNNGFEISMTDNSDYYHSLVFGSRENTNAGGIFQPELCITYSAGNIPTFTPIPAICLGEVFTLPTTSLEGITGSWSPALDPTTTTTYTFTPDSGQCATSTTLTVVVNSAVTPVFSIIAYQCQNSIPTDLPTTSQNGIIGTWSPSTIDTSTAGDYIYTFTPNSGQCANSTSINITIITSIIPTFTAIGPICTGDVSTTLPFSSFEGITGQWLPAFDNTNTTTYTFYPYPYQCAAPTTLTVVVSPLVTPTFTAVAPICTGDTLTALPTTSIEGITGTWSPALDNTTTTTYTFTPDAWQCATTTTLTITVNPATTNITSIKACSSYTWPVNGVTYTTSGTYTDIVGCTIGLLYLTIETPTTWYIDADGDGAGNPAISIVDCIQPTGYVNNDNDCDDTNATFSPCAIENRTDGIDNNCNGAIDEITTKLIASQCNANLTSINQLLFAQSVTIPGSTICGYRFKVTKWVGGAPSTLATDIQIITRSTPSFQLIMLPQYAYNTTYSVQVSVCVNGSWQPYGADCCTVRCDKLTKIQAVQCGTTIGDRYDWINADIVNFIMPTSYGRVYRFELIQVTPGTGFGSVHMFDNYLKRFSMNDIPSLTYDTTYSVRVAFLNVDGTWSPYGVACTITTPPFPTTQIQTSQCGITATSGSQNIWATIVPTSIAAPSHYRFRLTNTAQPYSQTQDNTTNYFYLNQFTGLLPSTTYDVEVSVEISGVYGPYGTMCTITTPAVFKAIPNSIESTTFDAVAYPNPAVDNFQIEVTSDSKAPIVIEVYDLLGRLIEEKQITIDTMSTQALGNSYPSGVYQVIVKQDAYLKTLRVIKR